MYDILDKLSLSNLLGIKKKDNEDDNLSKFLSDLLSKGNATITIKISALKTKAKKDENGIPYLQDIDTGEELQLPIIPPNYINRNSFTMDVLQNIQMLDFLNNVLGIPQEELLPPNIENLSLPETSSVLQPNIPAAPQNPLPDEIPPEIIKNILSNLQ